MSWFSHRKKQNIDRVEAKLNLNIDLNVGGEE